MKRQLASHAQRLYSGTAVTTAGSQVSGEQLPGIPHPVLEMETAGIAQAAIQSGIPLLSLRAISDGPRAPIPIDLTTTMDEDANLKVSELLKAVLRNPRIIIQSRRMVRNTARAAESAALALYAALNHWNE
jgi:nucleoside phosphorylase